MSKAIGIIEYNSIARGIISWDAMMKAASVDLIFSAPPMSGKI